MQKQYRLTNKRTFTALYKKGDRVGHKDMLLIILKGKHSGIKIGISVSKKIGNSVFRNLVRRRIRESVRLLLPRIECGYSYLFVARDGIIGKDYSQINSTVQSLLTRKRLLRAEV